MKTESTKSKLPKQPGGVVVDLNEHLAELFEMDVEIAAASPHILPLETPEELSHYLTEEHKTTTIIWNNDKGEITGYLSFEDSADEPGTSEVINLGVRPSFQRMGFGRMLMEHYFTMNKDKKKFRLVTHPKNIQAVAFYKSLGYKLIKEVENYFGDGEPRVVLEKVV